MVKKNSPASPIPDQPVKQWYEKWQFLIPVVVALVSFVYICIIFFSLSLKLDKIYFNQKRGTLYVMFMYVFGIICLAYVANFVL